MTIRTLGRTCAVLVALLTLVALVSCGKDAPQAETPAPVAAAAKGSPAPDFTLAKVGGGSMSLSDLRGQAVIIDFWDTWCPPCRRALPHLQELHDEYDGLTVVGVAFGREGAPAVQKFLADRNMTFPCVLMDEQFNVARSYGGVQSIPTTFLVDPQGVIREIWVGGYEKADYEAAIRQVLGV